MNQHRSRFFLGLAVGILPVFAFHVMAVTPNAVMLALPGVVKFVVVLAALGSVVVAIACAIAGLADWD